MKNVAIAALFGAAAFCFGASYATAPAYLFVAVAGLAAVWQGPGLPEGVGVMLRRLLFVSLAATVLYGWFVMVYPVLSTDNVRSWSLALGYTLGSLGSVFLLCRSAMSAWSTTIPAAAALLVVASFRSEAEVHAYLLLAGVAGFVYLAIENLPSNDDRRWQRIALLGVVAAAALALGTTIVVALPWTQSRVEETMMTIYTPSVGGSAGAASRPARRASAAEAFEEGRDARLERASAATPKSRVGPLRWHRLVARCGSFPRARAGRGRGGSR